MGGCETISLKLMPYSQQFKILPWWLYIASNSNHHCWNSLVSGSSLLQVFQAELSCVGDWRLRSFDGSWVGWGFKLSRSPVCNFRTCLPSLIRWTLIQKQAHFQTFKKGWEHSTFYQTMYVYKVLKRRIFVMAFKAAEN